MKIIILAAGLGSRLGLGIPKALVPVDEQRSILDHQLAALTKFCPLENIYVVVGYRKEMIIDRYPDLTFVYNHRYLETNTSQSLLKALTRTVGSDTIWINGDVYFEPEVIRRVVEFPGSCIAVNTSRVADEEVKYTVDGRGYINQISKSVKNGLGEAVGVNKIAASDQQFLLHGLLQCGDNDYFEAGVERALSQISFAPVDISDLSCLEIDFQQDLANARRLASLSAAPAPLAARG